MQFDRSHHTKALRLPALRLVFCALVAATLAQAGSLSLAAQDCEPSVSEQCANDLRDSDELWLVDTHSCACGTKVENLPVYRWDAGWKRETSNELWNSSLPLTTVYVHGNRMDRSKSTYRGQLIYKNILVRQERAPMRLVIWSWPSERVRGQLRDIRAKAQRADVESRILASALERMTAQKQISLIGYSFGARIISGAVNNLSEAAVSRGPIRAAFVAGGIDRNWLRTGGHHSRTLDRLESLLVLYNPCDPALARFRFVDKCKSAVAVGYQGLGFHSHNVPIQQQNVSHLIGKSHEELRYYQARPLFDSLGTFLTWER